MCLINPARCSLLVPRRRCFYCYTFRLINRALPCFSDKMNLFAYSLTLCTILSYLQADSALKYPYVTCGSVIKLFNRNFQVRLHSHDVKYGSGSGQQSITGTTEGNDDGSYWAVKGPSSEFCERGEPIKCGSKIRLEHVSTQKNLHSHLFKSPLSGNQEVSAFGENGEGDSGDNWTLVCSEDNWERNAFVRLKHVDTEGWLGVSGRTYGRPIHGQSEVVTTSYPDGSSYWRAAEGIFVKPNDMKEESSHDEL